MELVLQSLFGLLCTAVHSLAEAETPQLPPPRICGRYWSAKIDDISLWDPLELDHANEPFPLTKTSMTSLRARLQKEAVSWVPRC